MQPRYILSDVDDCILDWLTSFREWCAYKGLKTRGDRPTNYNLETWLPKGADVLGLINEFNRSPHFGLLLPFPDARSVLPRFKESGHPIVAITSCSSEPAVVAMRKRNLDEIFGENFFENVHCIDLGESKKSRLKKYPDGSLWVEDKFESAVDGALLGMTSVLIDRSHNQGVSHPYVKRVTDWYEIYKYAAVPERVQ